MNFTQSSYLNLLWLFLFLVFLLFHERKKEKRFLDACNNNKVPAESPLIAEYVDLEKRKRLWMQIVFLAGIGLLILAMAGPRWGLKSKLVEKRGIDIVLALDISKSMLTRDIPPSRMEMAKLELGSFIDSRRGDRIGIVAFAGNSFVACPLTMDYAAAKNFLRNLNPDIISAQGTDITGAIRLSLDMLKGYSGRERLIILLSDGEETTGDVKNILTEAVKEGISVYTLGFGTSTGGPVPVYDGNHKIVDYKKDRNGDTVVSRLDGELLKYIAEESGGIYSSGPGTVSEIARELAKKEKSLTKSRIYQHLEDRFQYPLFLAFVLFSLEITISERRKKR